jgi:hypothetical protein
MSLFFNSLVNYFLMRLLLLFALLSSINLLAQQPIQKVTIKGLVVDSSNNLPLSFATVVLVDARNGKSVLSSITKIDGTFEISISLGQPYNLELAAVGYHSRTVELSHFDITRTPAFELDKIYLSKSFGQLKDVLVLGAKPIVRHEIDRISYDVQADPESKSNDALEMLRKVPMVTVDGNDNIQLKGSSNYQIFIDGKPSALMANNPADVLKAMPAASIQKIEVITVPPSKYDAEGIIGIINIITLRKIDEGFSGSLFFRLNNIYGERGSASFNMKKGNFGLNILLGLGHQLLLTTESGSELINYSPATNLIQQGQNVNGGNFNNGQAQLSYTIDSLNLITASIDFFNRKFTQNNFNYTQFFSPPDSLTQSYELNSIGKSSFGAFDFGGSYQLGFSQRKDEFLTLSYQYSSGTSNLNNAITATDEFNYAGNPYHQQNSTSSVEQTLQLDFVKPVKKLIIEAGAKGIFRVNFSNFGDQNVDSANGQLVIDSLLTNQFNYHQNVYSLYNSEQYTLTNWTFKAGLRIENTAISSGYVDTTAKLDQNYINLIPSVSVQHKYQNIGSFTFGFTERIQRPGIQQLNPFINRSNPEFLTTGNPALRPVLNHIIEFSYSNFRKTSLYASVNYAYSNNTIQNVTSLINDSVSLTTYLNVGKNKSVGMNLSANYPVTYKLNLGINAQVSHLWISGTYNSQYYQNDGNQGNVFAFSRYNFNHDWIAAINFGYNSGNVYLQGKSSDFFYTGLNIIKELFKKRASISLTIYDPFREYNRYSSYTNTPDFYQSMYARNYYRNFRLAFNCKFGRLKSQAQSNQRDIKNEDIPAVPNSESH